MRAFLGRSVLPVILVAAILAPQAAQQPLDETSRLAALCRVWGLLKYYHPDVARGTIDWDQTLIEAIPRVMAAQSHADLNHELMALARSAGMAFPTGSVHGALLPGTVFGWLDEGAVIDPAVAGYLKLIVTGNQPAPANRYVKGTTYGGNPDFSGDAAGYEGSTYPDQAHRLLGLFRYWNMVQYFCPGRRLIDRDWADVLEEFVPRMQHAADATEYHLALAELVANISDTHGVVGSAVFNAYLGSYTIPVQTRLIEGRTVIVKVFPRLMGGNVDLRVGDIVTRIDGTPAATVRSGLRKYTNASNPDSLERSIDRLLLRSVTNAPRTLVVTHDTGVSASVSVVPAQVTDWSAEVSASLDPTAYRLLADDIGYLNMGVLEGTDVPAAMDLLRNTRAIIIDLRRYPNGTVWTLLSYLEPTATPMALFLAPDYQHPGSFKWLQPVVMGPSTPNAAYYKGRLVVLMDENTQSQGEYSVMGFRSAPATTVIGSRTSGADGNVSLIELPGGFYTYFSGLGVFYPDGTPTQRIGIVPDIEVRPTIAGIRQGRDELMEAAIAFINSHPAPTQRGNREKTSTDPDRRRGVGAHVRDKR